MFVCLFVFCQPEKPYHFFGSISNVSPQSMVKNPSESGILLALCLCSRLYSLHSLIPSSLPVEVKGSIYLLCGLAVISCFLLDALIIVLQGKLSRVQCCFHQQGQTSQNSVTREHILVNFKYIKVQTVEFCQCLWENRIF